MSKVIITEQYLTDIANAIRSHLNVENTFKPSQMSAAIRSIPKTMYSSGFVTITQGGDADTVQDGAIIQLSTLLTWNNTAVVPS